MKTTIKLLMVALALAFFASCSSSLLINSSAPVNDDGIYYYADGKTAVTETPEGAGDKVLDMEKLEKKYKDFLANDSSESNDTVLFNNAYVNPYDRLLVDSYQDAYERRLSARSNPYYGLYSWAYRYSSDYWYASAFDPSFYNVLVVGNEVWVEPTWISNMFGWSYYSNPWLRNGYGFAFAFGSSYYGYGSNILSSSPWNFPTGAMWYGANTTKEYYEYGRRPGFGKVDFTNKETVSASVNSVRDNLATRQVTLGRNVSIDNNRSTRSELMGSQVAVNNTRRIQDPVKDESASNSRRVVVEPVRGANNSILRNERVNAPRSSMGTRTTDGATRISVDRSHTTSYTRPNPGNKNEFNGSKYSSDRGRSIGNAEKGNIRDSRSYNPPARTTLPSVTIPTRGSDISNSGGSTNTRGGSSNRGSGTSGSSSGTRSSSSSTTSTSTSTSSGSSSGTSTGNSRGNR